MRWIESLTEICADRFICRFNNPDKGSLRWAIVHRALLEYLMEINEIPDEAERDKLRHEILER